MGAPAVGEVHDGYQYNGGDPRDKKSWRWVGEGQGGPGQPQPVQNTQKFQDVMAATQAKADVKRIEDGTDMALEVPGRLDNADQVEGILNSGHGTPGLGADQRIFASKVPVLNMIPGIQPEDGANLEALKRIGSQGVLGDVSKLKGPLSDKDVAFLRSMQVDPSKSVSENRRVVEVQRWVAARENGYNAALRTWTAKLGGPSALNPQGQSFPEWWAAYAETYLPAPWTGRPMRHYEGEYAKQPAQAAPQRRPPPNQPPMPGAVRSRDGWNVEDPTKKGSFPVVQYDDQGPYIINSQGQKMRYDH